MSKFEFAGSKQVVLKDDKLGLAIVLVTSNITTLEIYISRSTSDGTITPVPLVNRFSSASILAFTSPFGNCQVWTIYQFASIQGMCTIYREGVPILEVERVKKIIEQIIVYMAKRRLLIDVKQGAAQQLIDLFPKDRIIFKQPYKNSTNSDMELIMIHVENLKDKEWLK